MLSDIHKGLLMFQKWKVKKVQFLRINLTECLKVQVAVYGWHAKTKQIEVYVPCWQNQFLLIAYSVWPTLLSIQIFTDSSFCECSASSSKIEHIFCHEQFFYSANMYCYSYHQTTNLLRIKSLIPASTLMFLPCGWAEHESTWQACF